MTGAERKWSLGQEVVWSKVEPYKIVRLVGPAGNVQIASDGRFHVFWHKDMGAQNDGQPDLVHHGGPRGFAGLKEVMHQHERVILRYAGLTIQLPLDQTGEIPIEEDKEGIPASGFTFPQLLKSMKVEFPGEQGVLAKWTGVMQEAVRDLPQIRSHGELAGIRDNLTKIGIELDRAINPYKKGAASRLGTGLRGSKGDLLSGLNDAQMLLLKRAQQTVSIVVGTMRRYNALETLQIEWNGIVNKLPFMAAEILIKLQSPSLLDDGSLEGVVRRNLLNETTGLEARLRQLQGEPYFFRAQQFIDSLRPLKTHWEKRALRDMLKILTPQAGELEIWKRRVREENTGIDFGKYNLG